MATLVWLSKTWKMRQDTDVCGIMPEGMLKEASVYWDRVMAEGGDTPKSIMLMVLDYGQLSFKQEVEAVVKAATEIFPYYKDSITADVSSALIKRLNPRGGLLFGTSDNSKLVGRNLALAIEACSQYPGSVSTLSFCFTQENDVPMPMDTTRQFVWHLQETLRLSDMARRVIAPLAEVDKMVALKQARKWWPNLFNVAFSCWAPIDGKPCGSCRHCIRFKMFEEATR